MGAQGLTKENRLYWLGRYAERAFMTIEVMERAYDVSIDGEPFDYRTWCAQMQIPCPYTGVDEFLTSYLFDPENPNSVVSSINHAFDNAVVLRGIITSASLSYLQLAKNVMDNASVSLAPMLDLQRVRDYLMAFKGCIDERVSNEALRMTVKCGFTVERIDLLVRMDYRTGELEKEYQRLASRLRRTHLARDGRRLQLLGDLASCPNPSDNRDVLIDCLENLFPDA